MFTIKTNKDHLRLHSASCKISARPNNGTKWSC